VKGGYYKFVQGCKLILLVMEEQVKCQNSRITPSERKVKFIPEYIIVRMREGYQKFVYWCHMILANLLLGEK
jgi:hypothetical protein